MKYIPAEKLIAEIERLKGLLIRGACAAQIEMETNCKDEAYNEILSFIASLQQGSPERICPRCVYYNKTEDGCEYPYGGRDCFINENGVYKCNGFEEVEQQEQQEVDIRKELGRLELMGCNDARDIRTIARHFYELGLNAGKK